MLFSGVCKVFCRYGYCDDAGEENYLVESPWSA